MNVNKLGLVSLFIILAALPGCWDWFGKKDKELVVVNVLDEDLYEDAHIKGSINVPFQNVMDFAEKNWDKERSHIVLYCSNYMCTASKIAAKQLQDKGYKHVWAYEGGTAEWYQKGLPITGEAKQGYLTMEVEPEKGDPENELYITVEELQKKMDEFSAKNV